MAKALPVCALLLLAPWVRADERPQPTETIIKLTVTPAAAPKPALRYELLPDLTEMNPGNPVLGYLKCFMEQNHFFYGKESVANQQKWEEAPLEDLPLEQLRNFGGHALRQADYAARLDTLDWQILLKARAEGVYLLLPDVQQLRRLASALKVRFRAEVAGRRFDEALRSAKTMFALSRHLGEHPTVIGNLVGAAIAFIAIGPLEEMIGQPGCPNLYWALTNLPEPLVGFQKGRSGERLLLLAELGGLDASTPMSEEQLARVVRKIDRLLSAAAKRGEPKKDARVWLAKHVKDEGHVKLTRKRLTEYGLSPDVLSQMPVLQVVLLDEKLAFEIWRDEGAKWAALPYWQAEEGLRQHATRKPKDALLGILETSVLTIRQAQARLEQRIALLRHVEAVRMYAAENRGKLPAKLADVKVPLPPDPVTGKAFAYRLEGQTAILRGTAPKGKEKNAGSNVRYEITIRK